MAASINKYLKWDKVVLGAFATPTAAIPTPVLETREEGGVEAVAATGNVGAAQDESGTPAQEKRLVRDEPETPAHEKRLARDESRAPRTRPDGSRPPKHSKSHSKKHHHRSSNKEEKRAKRAKKAGASKVAESISSPTGANLATPAIELGQPSQSAGGETIS